MVLGYESERMTSDCDPRGKAEQELLEKWQEAQKKSNIKFRIDNQAGVAQLPDGFEDRLVEANLSLEKLSFRKNMIWRYQKLRAYWGTT